MKVPKNEMVPIKYNSSNKINEEPLKFKIKDEPTDDSSLNLTKCADETAETSSKGDGSEIVCDDSKIGISFYTKLGDNTNIIEEEQKYISINKNKHEMPLKFEIKYEPTDDSSLNLTKCADETAETSCKDDGCETVWKDSKVDTNYCNNLVENMDIVGREEHFKSTNIVNQEKPLKFEIKDELTDDNHSIKKPSEEHLIPKTNHVYVTEKREFIVFRNTFGSNSTTSEIEPLNDTSANKMPLKLEIKDEPMESLNVTACADETVKTLSNRNGSEIGCEDLKEKNIKLAKKKKHEMPGIFEIKVEPVDYYTSNLTECVDDAIDPLYMGDDSETYSQNSKINSGRIPENNVAECLGKSAEDEKQMSVNETTTENKYHCDICNKSFTNCFRLKIHTRIHTGEKPYRCDVCNKCFSQSSSLNLHRRTHTGEKPYQCDICNKCFSLSSHLISHKSTHTGEKPNQCDVCNKRFGRLSTLNVHKRIHTGEKPNQCDVCNKCFSQLSSLNLHRRTHTGEKPYQCDVCNKCFSLSTHLINHKRTHTGEKPYRCDVCNKRFGHLNNLNVHKRTHTGEKPYQCAVCNKRFSHSSSLSFHKRSHTDEKS